MLEMSIDDPLSQLVEKELIPRIAQSSFIKKCDNGTVAISELKAYVVQQYHYSRHFTRYLCALMSNLDDSEDLEILARNLCEELGYDEKDAISHRKLYLKMMNDLGVFPHIEPPFPETIYFVNNMMSCCRNNNSLVALTGLCLAAEAIVPYLYSKIIKGFKQYNIPDETLYFFKIHIECDDDHAIVMCEMIQKLLAKNPRDIQIVKDTAISLIEDRVNILHQLVREKELI